LGHVALNYHLDFRSLATMGNRLRHITHRDPRQAVCFIPIHNIQEIKLFEKTLESSIFALYCQTDLLCMSSLNVKQLNDNIITILANV